MLPTPLTPQPKHSLQSYRAHTQCPCTPAALESVGNIFKYSLLLLVTYPLDPRTQAQPYKATGHIHNVPARPLHLFQS